MWNSPRHTRSLSLSKEISLRSLYKLLIVLSIWTQIRSLSILLNTIDVSLWTRSLSLRLNFFSHISFTLQHWASPIPNQSLWYIFELWFFRLWLMLVFDFKPNWLIPMLLCISHFVILAIIIDRFHFLFYFMRLESVDFYIFQGKYQHQSILWSPSLIIL
jgi:hypothetical protein